jgi:hypothetical protein
VLSHRYITKWSAACTVSPARCLRIQHTKLFWFLGWWDWRIQFKLMCLTIDVLPSGLLLVLSHQLDVYGFNIPNYFGSLGWWDWKCNINVCAFNHRYIPKWSAACIVSPARCLWIEHTKLFWFLGLMRPEMQYKLMCF